jgi:isochorismate hydrolase
MPHVRSPNRLQAGRSAMLVIDLQEKFYPHIRGADALVHQIERLIEAAEVLSVPAAATVQYPKGLGPLVESLREAFPTAEEKLDFSAAVCRDSIDRWTSESRDQIVVVGIETHVCVQQTVLDLIAEGLRPFVVADAVAARHERDHDLAIARMRDNGATITTVESVLFEWLGTADRAEFKTISKIVQRGSSPS